MIWHLSFPGYTEGMEQNDFKKYQDKILAAVQKLEDSKYFDAQDKNLTLVNAFVPIPVQGSLGFRVLEANLPSIAVISEDTGRIYYFALKVLVPDVYRELYP